MTPPPDPRAAASACTPDLTLVEMFAARLLAHRTPKSAFRPPQTTTDEPDLAAMQNDDFDAASEPAEVTLPPAVIPPSQLLICHRLAARFGPLEDIERFRAPVVFSILQGFGAENHDLILNILKVVLTDQGWQIVSPSVSDGAVSKTAAERLAFRAASAGAAGSATSDLPQATRWAVGIETTWGLGDLGPMWMPAPETVLLTDEQLRNRVRSRMEAAEERAIALLTNHRATLLGLAETLLEKRSMGADEILPWVRAVQSQTMESPEQQI